MISDIEDLIPPYGEYARNGEWEKYEASLSREGMFWWFNLDIKTLRAHLAPLADVLDRREDGGGPPDRLRFLSQTVDNRLDNDALERHYSAFVNGGDWETAAASATAGVMAVWESGRDFQRFDSWHERIGALVAGRGRIPPVARASLLWSKCLIEFAAAGDPRLAIESAAQAVSWSRRAGSNNLRVYNAMMYIYACLWSADLCRLESSISDARILCGLSDVSFIPRAAFQFMFGLYLLLFGRVADSRRELEEILAHRETEGLSNHLWLLGQFNVLHAAVSQNDTAWIRRVVEAMEGRGVDAATPYQASLYHFILSVARLNQGRIETARRLAERALDLGRRSGTPVPEHHVSLLLAQVLSEAGDLEAAGDLLETWKGIWRERGYNLYVITTHLETARILLRRGHVEGARHAYDQAARMWMYGDTPHAMNRPREFVRKIRADLVRRPGQRTVGSPAPPQAVAIETFGGLRIHIGGATLDGDRWRGRKTKALLKALIVLGGSRISSDRIMDMLWPGADGAQAAVSLKVSLSRLRRIGCAKGEKPLPWIRVRHKRISLVRPACRVDALRFRECAARGTRTDMDVESLREAVDLYKADFLPDDAGLDWVIDHRRTLRAEYVEAAALLGERLLRMARADEAAEVLGRAVAKIRLDADLYTLLMRAHLDMGRPGKAREVYHAAAEAFQKGLGIDPDPKLVSLARSAGLL